MGQRRGDHIRRRDLLLAALGGTIMGSWARSVPVAAAELGKPRQPYILLIVLGGGIDAIWSANPKTRADVAADVDIPYGPAEIVSAGQLQLGPLFSYLAPHAKHLGIVNGVAVNTAGHVPGYDQILRMRLGYQGSLPAILDVIGAHRDGQPLSCVTGGNITFSSTAVQTRALIDVQELDRDDQAIIARTLRSEAGSLRRASGDQRTSTAAANAESAASYIERAMDVRPFKAYRWGKSDRAQNFAAELQLANWLFQHNLARTMLIDAGGFDTHRYNAEQKSLASDRFPMLDRALGLMASTPSGGGSVLDNCLIVMASELGRFPVLNRMLGKDHFPEIPMIFMGGGVPGARGRAYGATGAKMEALPVSPRTGLSKRGGAVLDLDDAGATILHMAGLNPRTYGYMGRILEFLAET